MAQGLNGIVSLDTLVRRATSGLRPDSKRMLKPSLTYRLERDLWGVYQDYHGPQQEQVDETTRYERLRMAGGERFENEWVKKMYPDAFKVPGYREEDLRLTIEAMSRGVRAIHHPQLWLLKKELYGQGDILVRSDTAPSDLGPWHYRVKECKRSTKVQPYQKLQAALYNLILGKIQGYTPPTFDIVLPHGEEEVATEDTEEDLNVLIDVWRAIRDGTVRPEVPGTDEALSPWRVYANKLLLQRRDITIIAGITGRTRLKLREECGVQNLEDLARLTQKDFEHVFSDDSAERHYWQVRAYIEKRAILLPGASLHLPIQGRHVYWDFETSDKIHANEPPHAYMIGTLEDGKYRAFVARGADDEERMFREFLEFIGPPNAVNLYQWTGFEEKVLEHAAERHPKIANQLQALTGSCVDLYKLVKAAVALPVSSMSIKDVAPAFGFNWRQPGVDGFASMVKYWDWLESDDFEDIKPVLIYNEDDVRAMQAVVLGLQNAGLVTP